MNNAKNLVLAENGIYYATSKHSVSYPDEGTAEVLKLETNSFWFRHRANVIKEALKLFNQPTSSFVDIGGGTGYVCKVLQEQGCDAVLLEPDDVGALSAKSRGVRKVVCSTLEGAGFELGSLESCGAFDVVEHIEKDVEFLETIKSYLKPEGHIYITVPAYELLWSHEDDYAEHYRRYTLTSMKRTLERAGLQPVYSTYIFSFLPLPVFAMRSMPYRLGTKYIPGDGDRYSKEHASKEGLMGRLISGVLDWELSQVRSRKRIPIGGSCFVVAKRAE